MKVFIFLIQSQVPVGIERIIESDVRPGAPHKDLSLDVTIVADDSDPFEGVWHLKVSENHVASAIFEIILAWVHVWGGPYVRAPEKVVVAITCVVGPRVGAVLVPIKQTTHTIILISGVIVGGEDKLQGSNEKQVFIHFNII